MPSMEVTATMAGFSTTGTCDIEFGLFLGSKYGPVFTNLEGY